MEFRLQVAEGAGADAGISFFSAGSIVALWGSVTNADNAFPSAFSVDLIE